VLGATTRHRWAYACSKALDEFLALAHWKERQLPVVIVRFFNTVGPRQTGQYGMVVPTFVHQALAGEPITVFGDGTQSRSFTYVGDVVGALLKLMVEPRAVGEVFNIGNTRRCPSAAWPSA
jgi:UDP-glucose 4-epimerase